MDGLTSGQHLDKLVDAFGAGFWLLGASDPVEDGVPVRTCEHFEHRARARIGTQGSIEVLRHLDAGLSGVGGLPSTVLSRLPHLVLTGSMHPAGGDQPLRDGSVPLRPRASSSSRREASSERRGVTTPVDRRSSRSRAPRQAPRRTTGSSDRPFPSWPAPARHPLNRRDGRAASFATRRRPRPGALGDPRRLTVGPRAAVGRHLGHGRAQAAPASSSRSARAMRVKRAGIGQAGSTTPSRVAPMPRRSR